MAELTEKTPDHVQHLGLLADDKLRTRCIVSNACCSFSFTRTNRIVGRVTASQIASASTASVLPRFTYGLT